MKKKALILMSFFAMAMTVALAQNPDKGNGTCPKAKTECCAKSCADKKCDLPARRTARKPVSKPGTAKQPARVNVRMGMQKIADFH